MIFDVFVLADAGGELAELCGQVFMGLGVGLGVGVGAGLGLAVC